MFIFFIVVWIVAIFCIFKKFEFDDIKNIEENYDPVDDPEYMKKNPEINLRDIINNQVLDNEFNNVDSAEGSADNSAEGSIIGSADNSENKKNN